LNIPGPVALPMPVSTFGNSFAGLSPPEDKVHYLQPDYRRNLAGCPHGVEFWVAIRTVSRDDESVMLQWCMSCGEVEILKEDDYNRIRLVEMLPHDHATDHEQPE